MALLPTQRTMVKENG
ncbi:rCG63232 [Rattus norvegicus]|uniref:RCG63232 n=1 Tax=Rattus norvegicus TaxID=10116 RepID=A6IYT0_RAT|nr:rCG63232 [Rattus norvegicus]